MKQAKQAAAKAEMTTAARARLARVRELLQSVAILAVRAQTEIDCEFDVQAVGTIELIEGDMGKIGEELEAIAKEAASAPAKARGKGKCCPHCGNRKGLQDNGLRSTHADFTLLCVARVQKSKSSFASRGKEPRLVEVAPDGTVACGMQWSPNA